jgi:mannose-1-phosphate guanylyltransferase
MRYAMIMAGGAGTRLWPLSRRGTPKQFLPLIPGGGGPPRSLLQVAAGRLEGLIPPERRYVCSGEAFRGQVLDALPGLSDERYLGEPEGRDSVNAVGFAAAVLEKVDPEAIFCALTADHIIEPVDEFQRRIDVGFRLVEQDPSRLVTFSIEPTSAATRYGYVQRGEAIAGFDGAFEAPRFMEKPDEATARQYVASGEFGWNSGMFVWSARTFMRCIEVFMPENFAALKEIQGAWGTPRQAETIGRVYPELAKTSVDYGVMEPAAGPRAAEAGARVATVSMDLRWLDVGTWPSYSETLTPDAAGNRAAALAPGAAAYVADSSNNLVVNSDAGHAVALVGCAGLVVVHTPEATLVMPAARAEELKKLHGELPEGLR